MMNQYCANSLKTPILATILLMLIRNGIIAQCYIACTGRGQLIPSYPSYTITASATWSGEEYYRIGNNDLTISGTGTVLTIDGPCIEFNHETPREIIIESGATLILTGGTTLYGSAATPWKGIRIRSGGTLIIEGTTLPYNATIAFAKNAVLAENTTTESVFSISGASFCDNQTGIRIQPYSGTMTSSVVGSRFSAPGIIDGKHGALNSGIYVNQVKPVADFLIGDGLQYHTGLENEFHDLNIAIQIFDSHVLVADNFIHDVGTGIRSTASMSSAGRLQVGQEYNPLFPHKVYNVIENVSEGIVVANNVHANIYQNKIISDFNMGSGTYAMDRGIQITNNCPHVFLNNVTIQGFNEYGVYIDNIAAADSIVINQSLIQEPSNFSESLTPSGIWISDAAGALVNMNSNLITNVLRGMELLNVADPQIYFNLITYEAKTDAGGIFNAYGIKLTNCADAILGSNSCTGNYTPGLEDVVRGIYTDHCTNFMIRDNFIADAGYGLYIYETSSEGQMLCNLMDNCNTGIYLLDIGGDIGLPPLHSPMGDGEPSENHWLPEGSANRFTTDEYLSTTKAQYTIWNYDNVPQAYTIPGFITEIEGSAPTPAEMDREGAACLAYSELHGDESDHKTAQTESESNFDLWVARYGDAVLDNTAGSWFMCYEFWKRIQTKDIAVSDLNSKVFSLHEHIRNTNIPSFVGLVDALSNAEHASAQNLLDNINPVNNIEYYWKLTAQIYLNSLSPSGILALSAEDELTLRDIAALNGIHYGPAVFYAWGMLDTVVEHNIAMSEGFQLDSVLDDIVIAPNPTGNHIIFTSATDKYYTLEIYTMIGEKVLFRENMLSGEQLDLSQMQSGVYMLFIKHANVMVGSEKIILAK